MYTSDKRLYVTADGKVVEEGDPAAVSLLVGIGGQLSDEDARRYGLIADNAGPVEAEEVKAKQQAPVNKAKAPVVNKAADVVVNTPEADEKLAPVQGRRADEGLKP